MNGLDIAIIAVLVASIVYSTFRGLIEEIFSLLAVVLGFLLASWGYPFLAPIVSKHIESKAFVPVVSYAIIFFGVAISLTIVGIILKRLLRMIRMRWLDRLGGAFFGFVKASLIILAVVLPLTAFLPTDTPLIRDSQLVPLVMKGVNYAVTLVPESLYEKYTEKRDSLLEKWQKKATDEIDPKKLSEEVKEAADTLSNEGQDSDKAK